jgi:hypothetical protein
VPVLIFIAEWLYLSKLDQKKLNRNEQDC